MAVRRESVVIDGTDNLTPILLREAAAAKLLNRELRNLSGININVRGLANVERDIVKTSRALDDGGNALDSFSGRAGLALQAVGALGAGLIPIGALALPAITGLTAAVGALAVAGAGAVIAFQGVGEATKALDAYDLEPTAANLEKARQAMAAIGPDAQRFVMEFQKFQPVLTDIRDSAAAGLFPGLTESLDDFEGIAPKIEEIFQRVGEASGQVLADTAESLNSDRWRPFMDFIADEAPAAITSLAASVGDLGHGLASMLMASDSGSDAFLGWVEDVASGFDDWASSSRGREDIAAFLDYVEETGPAVGEFFGSLVNAVAQIVQAAAPLGGPVLAGLTAVTDVIGTIAGSDLGTPIMAGVAALSLYSRALATTAAIQRSTFGRAAAGQAAAGASFGGFLGGKANSVREAGAAMLSVASASDRASKSTAEFAAAEAKKNAAIRGGVATIGKAGAAVAGLALLSTGAADKIGVTNTASLALMGTMAGPWGTAIGGAVGAVLDLRAANEDLTASVDAANAAVDAGDFDAYREQASAARAELNEGLGDTWLSTSQNVGKSWARNLGASLGVVKQSTGEIRNELKSLDAQVVALDWGDQLFDWGIESEGGRIKEVGAAIGSIGSEADKAAASADRLQAALDGLLSPTLDAEAATDKWRQSLKDLRTELDAGAGFTEFTEAGRANRELTRGFVEDTQTRLVAMARDGASRKELAGVVRDSREAFIRSGVAAGFDRDQMIRRANALKLTPKLVRTVFQGVNAERVANQAAALRKTFDRLPKRVQSDIRANGIPKTAADVNRLTRLYNLTPKQKSTLMKLVDQASGKGKAVQALLKALGAMNPTALAELIDRVTGGVASARGALNGLDGTTATTYINTIRRTFGFDNNADGGIYQGGLRAFADGGYGENGQYYSRTSQIVPGGANIIWAEQETGREAYISDKPSMRERNKDILGEVAGWYGMGLTPMANGGTRGAKQAGGDSFELAFGKGAKALGGSLKELKKALDRNKGALDKLTEKRNTYSSAVSGNFRTNPFATDNDPWSGAGNDPLAILKADISNAQQFNQLRASLGNRVKGDALAEVDTLEEARQLAAYSPDQQREYQRLYAQRQSVSASVGQQAATAAYGTTTRLEEKVERVERAIKQLEKSNKKNSDDNADRTGRNVQGGINRQADKGRKRRAGFSAAL